MPVALLKISVAEVKAAPFQYRLSLRRLMLTSTLATPEPAPSLAVPHMSPMAGVLQPAFQPLVL